MKVLLDQNVFFEVTALLRAAGFEVKHARELGLARAGDPEILRYAAEQGFTVVTHDDDFHMLLALGMSSRPSVVRLRVMLPPGDLVLVIADTLRNFADAIIAGAAVSVTARGVRLHRLPIS